MLLLLLLALLLVPSSTRYAQSKPLDIYWIDVEGGAATLIVSPSGESFLIDTGWMVGDRDAQRIYAATQLAGVKKIDYLLISHFHADHVGGLAAFSKMMPIGKFYDHGDTIEKENQQWLDSYTTASAGKRTIVKPGDEIPVKGLRVLVVASDQKVLAKPVNGGGPNPLCATAEQKAPIGLENQRVAGVLAANPLLGHSHAAYMVIRGIESVAKSKDIFKSSKKTTLASLFAMPEEIVKDHDREFAVQLGLYQKYTRAIEAIAQRRGVGNLLAEGSLRAAQTLGAAAVDLTVTVKGQELPAHMPQHKRSLGLIYAVNAFGADHQSSEHDSMLKAKPDSLQKKRLGQLGDFPALDLRDLSDDKVRFAWRTQCFYSALDTLGLCQFVWGPSWQLYGPAETVELVRAGTGWDATLDELLTIGERKINLMRAFNAREGIGKSADTLPKKLFEPLGGKGPTAGVALTPEEFERARATYYELAGCDPATGYPTRAKLGELGLEWV